MNTKDQRRFLIAWLLDLFPWLDNDDEANGGDVVDTLCQIYHYLLLETAKSLKGKNHAKD